MSSEREAFARELVHGYGKFFLDNQEDPWGQWTRRMLYTENFHQVMTALCVYSGKCLPGWQVLTEVNWGGRDRTDLVFVPPEHEVESGLTKGTRKVEVKVIAASDWSDRWSYACSDLKRPKEPAAKTKKGQKPACDFLMAVIFDDLKERPTKRKPRAKLHFEALLDLPTGDRLEMGVHFSDVEGTRGVVPGGIRMLARWPSTGCKYAMVDHCSREYGSPKWHAPRPRVMLCALAQG